MALDHPFHVSTPGEMLDRNCLETGYSTAPIGSLTG